MLFPGYEKLQLKDEPSDLHVFMDDCELCNDGDLIPDIVEKNTLVLGQCYEEYMADIQKNDSMGKTTHVEKVAVNAEVKGQEEVNNNNDDKGKRFA